ncbi:MAG: FHA domain-containing protein [Chloroflexota bacterium]
MKAIHAFLLAVLVTLALVTSVGAQSPESIWLTANTTAYKTGETVIVTLNATSATMIQGFTFQIRYDPACLKPTNASSPISGMNGLPLPQLIGQADGSYASTTPQAINGILAEVRFVTLKGCQTNLTLESAALAIRNAAGYAAALPGVTMGEKNIALNIDKEVVQPQDAQPISGSLLQLTPPPPASGGIPGWLIGSVAILLVVAGVFVIFKRLSHETTTTVQKSSTSSGTARLQIKHGPHAGKNITLTKLPCRIGRDAMNEIRLDDPHVISQHAKIFTDNTGYYLMDLGGETYINGKAVIKSSAALKSGDVVRLGRSSVFVFGS